MGQLLLAAAVACAACALDRSGLETVIDPAGNQDARAALDGAGAGGAGADAATDGPGDGSGNRDAAIEAPAVSLVGCADGTREGYLNQLGYPLIAACAGGWDVPGLLSAAAHAPQCGRRSGNSSADPTGTGCSVADLCAQGWHVCESASEVFQIAGDCRDAAGPPGAGRAFYVTRQRAFGNICPAANDVGTSRLHGCGNFGVLDDRSCAPFPFMLRDADCQANAPWSCPVLTSGPAVRAEYETATKAGAGGGGALCCRD